MVKKHKELGAISDEHKDDIDNLVLFYRAIGGIQHLVPNPNVPLEKCTKTLKPLEQRPQILQMEEQIREQEKAETLRKNEETKRLNEETKRLHEETKRQNEESKENTEGVTVLEKFNRTVPFGQRSPFQVSKV